jgi:hypothetical protein
MTARDPLAEYWQARRAFERGLRKIPPALLCLTRKDLDQCLADIDIPGLVDPKQPPARQKRQ